MSKKINPMSEAELKAYYDDAEKYLLKPWRTRGTPEAEPLIVGGEGALFYDATGREYLDFLSQLFNVNLGIKHRKIVEAVKEQVEKVNYTKNTFLNKPKIQLAKRLAEVLCSVSRRVPRVYIENGEVVEIKDYLLA